MPNSYLKILENMPKICQQPRQKKTKAHEIESSAAPESLSVGTHTHLQFIASLWQVPIMRIAIRLLWQTVRTKGTRKFVNSQIRKFAATAIEVQQFFDCVSMLLRFDQLRYKTRKLNIYRERGEKRKNRKNETIS